MTDNDRIAKLEKQIARLESKQSELYDQLAEARLDQWRGRLEDLEVQVRLGAMDTNDRVNALVQKGRERWDDAKAQLTNATAAAGDVAETVRDGLESALDDIRKAILDAKAKAKTKT